MFTTSRASTPAKTGLMSRLFSVTVTGADDSTSIPEMLRLSALFPFLEWGILFSPRWAGTPRYPSESFVKELDEQVERHAANTGRPGVRLAQHLCGVYSREPWLLKAPSRFMARVQLNGWTHDKPVPSLGEGTRLILPARTIKSYAALSPRLTKNASVSKVDVLIDGSGGRGIPIDERLEGLTEAARVGNVCLGLAGGISPKTALSFAEKAWKELSGTSVPAWWIDMEFGARTKDGRSLDMVAIEEMCLSFAEKM